MLKIRIAIGTPPFISISENTLKSSVIEISQYTCEKYLFPSSRLKYLCSCKNKNSWKIENRSLSRSLSESLFFLCLILSRLNCVSVCVCVSVLFQSQGYIWVVHFICGVFVSWRILNLPNWIVKTHFHCNTTKILWVMVAISLAVRLLLSIGLRTVAGLADARGVG